MLGYRESSVPFSYLNARNEPIGYSIELCKSLASAIGDAVNRTLTIRWVPVTPDNRIDAVASGQVDLECGSTTSNLERQKRVAFSPIIFVAGTKVMVKKGSPIGSFRDLAGKKVAVTAGTTNEKTLRDLDRQVQARDSVAGGAASMRRASRRSPTVRPTRSPPTTCCSTA